MDIKVILSRLEAIEESLRGGAGIEHEEECECDCDLAAGGGVAEAISRLKLDIEIDARREGVQLVDC